MRPYHVEHTTITGEVRTHRIFARDRDDAIQFIKNVYRHCWRKLVSARLDNPGR